MTTPRTTTKTNIGPIRNGSRVRLALGSLPVKLRRLERDVHKYRRALEQACVERHGGIDHEQAHLIQAAAEAYQHSSIARWVMRHKWDTLTTDDLLKASEAIVKAGQSRNASVTRLKLGAPSAADHQATLVAQLYGPSDSSAVAADEPGAPQPTSEITQPDDAPASRTEPHRGCDFPESTLPRADDSTERSLPRDGDDTFVDRQLTDDKTIDIPGDKSGDTGTVPKNLDMSHNQQENEHDPT